jgi:hypothetical protein
MTEPGKFRDGACLLKKTIESRNYVSVRLFLSKWSVRLKIGKEMVRIG